MIAITITYLLAMMVGLDEVTTKSLLPRNVTAPIAMGISEIIGGIPSLTAIGCGDRHYRGGGRQFRA